MSNRLRIHLLDAIIVRCPALALEGDCSELEKDFSLQQQYNTALQTTDAFSNEKISIGFVINCHLVAFK